MNKTVLIKARQLSDRDLTKIIEIFDCCQECWTDKPEKCRFRPVRKKIGLKELKII